MRIERIAAFADGDQGGNPAGVAIVPVLPDAARMQAIAADLGYSETVFAAPLAGSDGTGWRVRYFSPEMEVAFCGHATIALGAALAWRQGDGRFALTLNDAAIMVEGRIRGDLAHAALRSPPTADRPASAVLVADALALFGYRADDLDPAIPPAIVHGGMDHLLLALRDRATLARMDYAMDAGRALMAHAGIVTILLLHAERHQLFHARNPFAIGGIREDPATGAAAAALGGYLRAIGWPHGRRIEIVQGADMGQPSRLIVDIDDAPGAGVTVSGIARRMEMRDAA